jgi:hypothetical protein
MFAKLDIKTVMQGLGLANEVALRSLTKEVVEAHNTKNMIPHPKIPDSFLIRSPTNRQESAMAVGRIIGEDSINSTPRWQHFPHQEWLIEALLAIAKTGFGHQRKRKKYLEKQLKENPKEKRGFRPRPYSGYCLTSLSPETNPQPAPQLAPTQAQTPFMTSHVPTTTLVAAPFPLVNSAFSTSSYPLESPRPDPPPRSPPSPTQSQLLSTTSQPPTSNATPLLIPTSISNLGRMILVVRRANISKSWTEPISFFLTEEALELEEAKLRERHFSYDVFESTLAQTSFLRYKGEEDQVMFQHSKLGIITIESASDWRTALNDSWQHYGDGMIRFSIKSRQAGFSQYPTPEYGLESLGDQDYGLPTLSYCVLMLT